MTRARTGALTVLGSAIFFGERRRLVDLAAKHRLPAVYTSKLMSFGPNLADSFRRAATYVDISKHAGRVNRESIVVDEMVA
jgi:putative ABC transport system substrate-binding protein